MAFTEDLSVFFNTAEFGEDATYTPLTGAPFATVVIVDKGVQLFPPDFDSQVIERWHVISLKAPDVPKPKRGDQVTVGTTTYKVDEVIADDGVVVKVRAR